jgi:tRNA(fMet)-specific endonuclease VapC
MFLLDTDTVIYSLKGHPAVMGNLQRHMHDTLKISVITFMKLYYGAFKSQQPAGNLAKIKTLEQATEIVPVGMETAELFGALKAQMESRGERLDDFDLILAACALAHNLTLVTNNTGHFKRIADLKLANWCEYPSNEKGDRFI